MRPAYLAAYTGALGLMLGYSLPSAIERLTNPLEDPGNYTCTTTGVIPAQTFTGYKSTLVISELTGFDCGNGVVHWRAAE